MKSQKLDTSYVYRVDHNWVHSRGGSGIDLSGKKVLIIGCGSLGGYVSELLAKSGIGTLLLMDNDKIEYENIGRHILGVEAISQKKSVALAKKLRSNLPHLEIESFYGDWRSWIEEDNELSDFDLVISTTGSWECERPLGYVQKNRKSFPLIMGWLEPYAIAGHSLFLPQESSACLECVFDQFGNFKFRYSDFVESTLVKEPGGCAFYQRYGPIDLFPTAQLVAKQAVDFLLGTLSGPEIASWVRAPDVVGEVGGTLHDEWPLELIPSGDSHSVRRELSLEMSCENCKLR